MSDLDKQAELIIQSFVDAGMTIESGAQFSVKGQIAQLINGALAYQAEIECEKMARVRSEIESELQKAKSQAGYIYVGEEVAFTKTLKIIDRIAG